MKLKHIVLALFVASQLASTGCWCLHRNRCSHAKQSGMPTGCNECSSYGPDAFGAPIHGSAMTQGTVPPVDERLATPAKQKAYEGPAK